MPIEDSIRKAAENLDEAANAAPSQKVVDGEESPTKNKNDADTSKQDVDEPEDSHDKSDD